MTQREFELRKSLEILLDELRTDDDFRDARRPPTSRAAAWSSPSFPSAR